MNDISIRQLKYQHYLQSYLQSYLKLYKASLSMCPPCPLCDPATFYPNTVRNTSLHFVTNNLLLLEAIGNVTSALCQHSSFPVVNWSGHLRWIEVHRTMDGSIIEVLTEIEEHDTLISCEHWKVDSPLDTE